MTIERRTDVPAASSVLVRRGSANAARRREPASRLSPVSRSAPRATVLDTTVGRSYSICGETCSAATGNLGTPCDEHHAIFVAAAGSQWPPTLERRDAASELVTPKYDGLPVFAAGSEWLKVLHRSRGRSHEPVDCCVPWGRKSPQAVRCLGDAWAALIPFLTFTPAARKLLYTTSSSVI